MKKMKKTIAIAVLATSLATLSVSAVSASAAPHKAYSNPIYSDLDTYHAGQVRNIADTDWDVGFGYWRHKCNTSSVYVKNNQSNGVYIYVYGLNSNGNAVSVAGNTFSTEGLELPGSQTRLIRQLVREKGYSMMQIDFVRTPDSGPEGVWSPDSVGDYDLLN